MMKVQWRRLAQISIAVGVLSALIFNFQNCSSQVQFDTIEKINSITGTTEEPQYAQLKVGDATNFPPLKLFFIVDNSGTMQANQISLSSAFSRMFANENADNLAPFDSTAYIFNTAQMSLPKSDSMFSRLPTNDTSVYTAMTLDQIMAGPRAQVLTGEVPGDLVGYRTTQSMVNGLPTITYMPAPVMNFDSKNMVTEASMGIHKGRLGSVNDLASEFARRINVLDPARSAMDPVARTGVLDRVIDKESGLCAAARIMRNKEQYLKAGDIAAFIIVSDEDDADEKGTACIQTNKDYQGTDEYFDGYCTTPKTTLNYHDVNPNPSAANCSVAYSTGFKYVYTYELPKTDVSYRIQQRDYTVRQTQVSYTAATHTFTQPRVVISYFTKAPTYEVPQSTITYFKRVESCDIRDGVKFNCTFTFPKFTTSPFEESYADCKKFQTGKLPADAILNDANYPVSCAMLANAKRTGACSTTDATKLNCNQNYSTARTSLAAINGAVTSTCANFATSAKASLPANAVIGDAGYDLMCADSPLANVAGSGLCPTTAGQTKLNCKENLVAMTSKGLDGIPTDATPASCMTFAVAQKSNLDSNAVLSNTNYEVRCNESAGRLVTNNEGLCSTAPAGTKLCSEHAAATASTNSYKGAPTANQTCKQFIQAAIGSNRVIADSPAPSCTLSAAPQTVTSSEKTMNYTNSVVANYTPKANDSCLDTLKTFIATNDAVPTPKTCVVKSIITGSSLQNQNMTCVQMTNANSYCMGTVARRECVGTDIIAGNPYAAAFTTSTFNGQFTCDTLCSDTGFCKSKPGTVGDNYKDCDVKYTPTNRNFTRELYSNRDKVCSTPESPTPTVTRQPYKEIGNRDEFVAGAKTEAGMPNALANYIRDTSDEFFGANTPAVSVFVRQPGDSLGTNGTYGTTYNTFADLMGGQKKTVLSSATEYADALQNLSTVIKDKLTRSFTIPVGNGSTIRRVWHRKAGTTSWGSPIDKSHWTAAGGTVTLNPDYEFSFGDDFKLEYY